MKWRVTIVTVVGVLLFSFTVNKPLRYTGKASDIVSGKLFYTEEHEEVMDGNKAQATSIIYKSAAGKVIVKKKIDYSKAAFLPDFVQEDLRDGYMEAATTENGVTTLKLRKKFGKETKEKSMKIPAPAVADGGFNCFVKEHWKELISGKTISFNFAVPSQLDYYSFRVYKVKGSDKGKIEFKMEANSFFLRKLLAPIILHYNPETHRLTQYQGISNINDDYGDNYKVKIVYPGIGP